MNPENEQESVADWYELDFGIAEQEQAKEKALELNELMMPEVDF